MIAAAWRLTRTTPRAHRSRRAAAIASARMRKGRRLRNAVKRLPPALTLALVALGVSPLGTQTPQNSPAALYAQHCASCHGPKLEGGAATSLLDDEWKFGSDDASLTASIRDGRAGTAMLPFKDVLNEQQIRMLV